MKYCGRDFSHADLACPRGVTQEDPDRTRWAIPRLVCEALAWRKPDSGLREMSCRVVLLRLQRDGHIRLPPPRRPGRGGKLRTHRTPQAEPQPALSVPAGQLRYFARAEGCPLALFGFDAAAWKTAKRDRFIGGTDR